MICLLVFWFCITGVISSCGLWYLLLVQRYPQTPRWTFLLVEVASAVHHLFIVNLPKSDGITSSGDFVWLSVRGENIRKCQQYISYTIHVVVYHVINIIIFLKSQTRRFWLLIKHSRLCLIIVAVHCCVNRYQRWCKVFSSSSFCSTNPTRWPK